MQTHTWYALLNKFKSAVCSFPSATVPFKPPLHPHRTCKPEYFTNTPITRSLPATTLIQYDGFILAIFSICPLRFFPLPTDGGNFSVTFSVCTVVKVPNCKHSQLSGGWKWGGFQTRRRLLHTRMQGCSGVRGARWPQQLHFTLARRRASRQRPALRCVISWMREGFGLRGCSPETSCASLRFSRWPSGCLAVPRRLVCTCAQIYMRETLSDLDMSARALRRASF